MYHWVGWPTYLFKGEIEEHLWVVLDLICKAVGQDDLGARASHDLVRPRVLEGQSSGCQNLHDLLAIAIVGL